MRRERAEQYRKRAGELRAIAEGWTNESEKQSALLCLAKDYENMADEAERDATMATPLRIIPGNPRELTRT